jgi:peptide/nickel transport system ATP-binding protein
MKEEKLEGTEMLIVNNVTKIFKGRGKVKEIKALENVSFSIKEGERIAIIGETGSGKSTLARILVGLDQPDEGEIIFRGNVIINRKRKLGEEIRKNFAIVFQDPYEALNPAKTVFESVSLPLKVRGIKDKETLRKLVHEALTDTRLIPPEDYAFKYPSELSGGQRQRVALARAIIYKPKLLIADEPTTMIDASLKADLLKLLLDIMEKYNMTLITITHDFSIAPIIADRLIVMYKGRIVEEGSMSEVIRTPKHPYTQALISAIPSFNRKIAMNFTRTDEEMENKGCRFYYRCQYRMDKCLNEEPALFNVHGRRVRCFLYET